MIIRDRRTSLVCTNLQRLVALENQTFQDELNTIRADVARNANTADSAKKSVTSIANVVVEAIKKIESRLDKLKYRTEKLENRNDERDQKVEANEIRQLRASIARIAKIQQLTEERLSDEVRFNLERAKIADASVRGFAKRVEAFSERLNGLVQEYNDLSASVGLLKQAGLPPPAAAPQAERANVRSETEVAPTGSNQFISQPRAPLGDNLISPSNVAPSAEPTNGGVAYPNDEAA